VSTTGTARSEPSDLRAPAVLATVAIAAWIAILTGFDGGGTGIVGFVAAWTGMMVAMMLPSAMPFILLYQRGATRRATAALAAGYLAVWSAVGIAAWALDAKAMDIPVPVVLLVAGLYQLTPVKNACLRRCRTPADFLVERWRSNAFILGADHGRYCLGCCWALMVVLVVAGMMGIIWVVAIAAIVAVEKLSSRGAGLPRWIGIALIVLAIWKAVV
jgi:predicted metal-binding membrane protein